MNIGKESLLPLEAIYKFMIEKKNVEFFTRNGLLKGKIIGFDEYMNIIIENNGKRTLLKGECIFQLKI